MVEAIAREREGMENLVAIALEGSRRDLKSAEGSIRRQRRDQQSRNCRWVCERKREMVRKRLPKTAAVRHGPPQSLDEGSRPRAGLAGRNRVCESAI